ncbi:MAG: hypothetical protein AB1Z22_01310 [Synechococcaceae cyanobacterium]
MSMSTRSLFPTPHPSRSHASRSAVPLSCPVRRPSRRPAAEAPLTWEELLGRR